MFGQIWSKHSKKYIKNNKNSWILGRTDWWKLILGGFWIFNNLTFFVGFMLTFFEGLGLGFFRRIFEILFYGEVK